MANEAKGRKKRWRDGGLEWRNDGTKRRQMNGTNSNLASSDEEGHASVG
nr:hypothetical protein [Bacteroidota bacterium]